MKLSFLTLICLIPSILLGQEKKIPLNVSLYNQATAIPFTKFLTVPLHPGIQVGTEFNYKNNGKSRLFQTASVNYFYHQYLTQGLGVLSEFGYEYRFPFGLALEGRLGVGYTHTFATTEEFTFSNGTYQKKKDKGNARLTPSLSIDFGYYVKKNHPNSPKVFIRYQSWVEYPYSPDFIPLMTHINLHIGAKFNIITKKSTEKSND